MAVAPNSIVTPQGAISKTAVCTAAETGFNAPSAVVTLIDDATQNVNGLRITSLVAIPRASIGTACNCQVYKKVGSTYTLIDSALMATVTPGAAVANPKTDFGYSEDNPLVLEPGVGLAVAIGQAVANGIVFRASGGVY